MVGEAKRGQAAGAAILLAVIGALLVLFIVLIPPQDRLELLGESESSTSEGTTTSTVPEVNLITENPGRVDYLSQKEIEHPIPVINIYTKTDTNILAEKNNIYIRKSIFSEEDNSMKFTIDDIKYTNNLLLNFNPEKAEGRITILLNGEEIVNSEASKIISPINLPQSLLQKDNELIFKVSSPGIKFWSVNEISLNYVKVIADVTNIESQYSKHIFLVSETERNNLEKTTLKFHPNCNYETVGKLSVEINGKEIYNAVPDCDLSLIPIEFTQDTLQLGENQIVFKTEKGNYLLDHIVIESGLKEVEFPTYYFELSYEQYQSVINNDRRIRLELDFVDSIAQKYGSVIFNGYARNFDTRELTTTIDLSDDVVQGSNSVVIKPKKSLDIRELKVDLLK